MENYIMLDGVKIELTEEQIKIFRDAVKQKSPFARCEKGDAYFMIDEYGRVGGVTETDENTDFECHENANYCTDRELMEQRALQEILNRRLWRFSVEKEDSESDTKWYIVKKATYPTLTVLGYSASDYIGAVGFANEETARRAIYEIVEPFMKENPEFKLEC